MSRKIITIWFDADTYRLYWNIDDAIKYLQEVKEQYKWIDIRLHENWRWYEDMTMSFQYEREENDGEYNLRMKIKKEEAERRAGERKKIKERESRRKEYEKLKREFW